SFLVVSALLLAACGGQSSATGKPSALVLPESTSVLDAASGKPITTAELLRRTEAADFVLLGEVHDNPVQHQARGSILSRTTRKPGVVFEQLARASGPIAPPAAGQSEEDWLDAHGFDRKSWKWPLHKPVVDAALSKAGSLWGSNVPREALRPVVRQGVSA